MIVVQIVVACLRADAPGFAGGEACTSELDRLAAEGTRTHNMIVSGSFSVPSLVSMMTGAFPHQVGLARWRHRWPARRPTLMSAFQAAGFETRLLAYNPRWLFGSCPQRGPVGCSQRLDDVVQALKAPRGTDRFVLIHHWWTHLPYLPMKIEAPLWKRSRDAAIEALRRDPEAMVPKLKSMYRDAVTFFSEQLLPVYVDAAGSAGDDVLIVVTGDSGEDWGEALPAQRPIRHHFDLGGHWQRDATTAVPLVLWGRSQAGSVPAGVLEGTPRGVDLAPTIAALAGVPWPGPLPPEGGDTLVDHGIGDGGQGLGLEGRSIATEVLSGNPLPRRDLLVASSHNTHEPDVYPQDGRQLWRNLSLRTADRWYVWDGAQGNGEVRSPAGQPMEATEGDGPLWDRLRARWHQSVSPGPTVPRSRFPAFNKK